MGTELKIYTDGGCSGNPGPGGWAYVIAADSGDRAQIESHTIIAEKWGAEKNTTNNRMEMTAVIAALEAVKKSALSPAKITIFTDSQYVQKGITLWIKGWKQKGWRTKGREAVKNQDLWQLLDSLAGCFSIDWTWIRGHAGNELNERCDQMTQDAIASLGRGQS